MPLEAIFTVNEENGFTGVDGVEPGLLSGSVLINVDSEQEGAFTIGSAVGADVDARATYAEEPGSGIGTHLPPQQETATAASGRFR